ncbi:MAG: hypothetical protein HKM07_07120 [Chlamydiae bacterium]|nr:hypothetical protein [Chlamydiota bacterium]
MDIEQIKEIASLAEAVKKSSSFQEKLAILQENKRVQIFFTAPSMIRTFLAGLSQDCEVVILSLIAIGQGEKFFSELGNIPSPITSLRKLIEDLLPVEHFYASIGGIIGYHLMMIERIFPKHGKKEVKQEEYLPPVPIDITNETEEVKREILWGLEHLPSIGEIYPVGGAADRLGLKEEKTEVPLPAAKLLFCGKTLLEGLISDLQAREYLHYKIYKKQETVPIALMTSHEKDNHAKILSILEENKWFKRGKENFTLFCQPLVPTIDSEGNWCLRGPLHLLLKPGGHGVIWKLAKDQGVFDWFYAKKREKVLIRQINNPVAGTDYGLLAFTGIGCEKQKNFGFASCQRKVQSAEGVDVLVKKKTKEGYEYCLTNVEYCDFSFRNIADEPIEVGGDYSRFLSNTNILFADLKVIESLLPICFLPGMLINLKKSSFTADDGTKKEMMIARLESTMQNIADHMGETFSHELSKEECKGLKTFLTYNERKKTISTVKKAYTFGSSFLETPEGCFLDILHNAKELLSKHCGMQVSEVNDAIHFFLTGPSFLFLYHPALGPLYSIIAQKIRGGRLGFYSELQLNLAEAYLENVDIEGSLLVHALQPLGKCNSSDRIEYSGESGKCQLKNVLIRNMGIDREALNVFWKNEIIRKESCEIILLGNGEFYAENVTLPGNQKIIVKDGYRVKAYEKNGALCFHEESITSPSWYFEYKIGKNSDIRLKKIEKS